MKLNELQTGKSARIISVGDPNTQDLVKAENSTQKKMKILCQGVLSFLPIIVTMFFFLSLLEDSGYIARLALPHSPQ